MWFSLEDNWKERKIKHFLEEVQKKLKQIIVKHNYHIILCYKFLLELESRLKLFNNILIDINIFCVDLLAIIDSHKRYINRNNFNTKKISITAVENP